MFRTAARTSLAILLMLGVDPPPTVEVDLFMVSDASGTANSVTPGVELPFFEPGETVRITLRAVNTGDSVPVRASLKIASATDHGLLLYDSHAAGEDNTVDSPLDLAESDYYSFDWVVPADANWGNYDIVGSIHSADYLTVYDETAPGPSTTAFGAGAWHQAATVGLFGTTVIVHGYQLSGSIPDWPNTIAEDLRDRIERARIWTYSVGAGEFLVTSPYPGPAENILVFDWADESRHNYAGYSEAAAEGLFTALMVGASGPSPNWDINHLHLIGHSRGAVVVSETAQRLLAAGRSASHLTYLDPIWEGALGVVSDLDVNVNHPTLGTRGVAAWDMAGYVDNFYSTDRVHDEIIRLDGKPIEGARNVDLSGRGTGVGHSDLWRWYYGTIALDSTSIDGWPVEDAWYGGGNLERHEDGFAQSRLGGSPRSPMAGATTPVSFDWDVDGIVNGDLQRGPQGTASNTRPDPGWDRHSGGGPGVIQSNQIELELSDEYRIHNRVWVPAGFPNIQYHYDTGATAPGDPDTLVTYAIETDGSQSILDMLPVSGSPVSGTRTVSVASYIGDVISLRFGLIPAGGSVTSHVDIDDVQFWAASPIVALDGRVFLEGAYGGAASMSLLLNPDLPMLQPYDTLPWSYSGSESVGTMPADIVDWMLVELRSDTLASSAVGRRAALLTDSGKLVDLDGVSDLAFPTATPGSYYIVVYHRDHTSVMSSTKLNLSSGAGSWDFGSTLSSAYGSGMPMKALGDGNYGMFACDIDADGQVTASDFNAWLVDTKATRTGYVATDCNLDGQVTALDFNLWLVNTKAVAASQVPD